MNISVKSNVHAGAFAAKVNANPREQGGAKPVRGPSRPRPPGTLKAAVAALIDACGGQQRAAELCRVGKSQLGRYTLDDCPDQIPADVIECLEAIARDPVVTRYLASRANHALLALEPLTHATYSVLLSNIGKEGGEFFAEAALALVDGRLSPNEAGRVRAQAVEQVTALMAMIADIDRGDRE